MVVTDNKKQSKTFVKTESKPSTKKEGILYGSGGPPARRASVKVKASQLIKCRISWY